ncbi:hypothetical protein G9A89_014363 [Geosiphon pyriformis]|nr:hypothetical protein G9A89_014363 [Geosiphon pyriformis]
MEKRNVEQTSKSFKQTKSNIPPATITEDTILAAIFLFDINNLNIHSLFSEAAINQDKPIAALYTDARIIIADGNTKTLIREINNFSFKINKIQIPTKEMISCQKPMLLSTETSKNFNLYSMNSMSKFQLCVLWANNYQTELLPPPIWEEKEKSRAKEKPQSSSLEYVTSDQRNLFYQPLRLICIDCEKKLSTISACIGDNKKWPTTTKYYYRPYQVEQHANFEMMCLVEEEYVTRLNAWKQALNRLDGYSHNDHKIWRMANAKAKDTTCILKLILEIGFDLRRTKAKYCNKCDLMFNPPPRILFSITKLLEPKEEEILITKDMSFQNPTEDTETEQYLTYSNLSKELELKWYSNNKKRICPKRVYDTDTAPHSLEKIDLKIVLKIPITKREINVKREIINASYMGNIIVMLQNNLNRSYKIESQEKIAQAIFLFLIKIPQLISASLPEELMGLDQVEEKTYQSTSQKKTIQDQVLLFKADPEICSLADVANLYLPAKAHKHFKIPIHNLTEDVIKISKRTFIGSILPDIQHSEKPQSILDFAQLFLFCNIISQVWNLPKESYLFTPEEINKLNLGNLNTWQQMQFKVLLNQYANVFANKNKFGCTDIVKH